MPIPGTNKAFSYFVDVSQSQRQWLPLEGDRFNDDDVSTNQLGILAGAIQYIFDERTARLVRVRANRGGASLLASAARTVTTNSLTQTNRNWRGLHVNINVTAHGGGLGIVPHIQGRTPLTNLFYDILVGTTIAATGLVTIKVYPGITAVAGASASDILPYEWRFQMEALDANSHTYQVEAQLVI